MAHWPEIVGDPLARQCEPERIRWPRGTGELAQKLGGTLVIRAEPGRGLDLQHESHQIIERINQFYGYGAVTAVKIMQGHVASGKPPKNKDNPLDSETEKALETQLERSPTKSSKRPCTGSVPGPWQAGRSPQDK